MSGGYFDYHQYDIGQIVEQIEDVIYKHNNPDHAEYPRHYSEQTIDAMELAIKYLEIAQIYAHRIDWLLSGDDGEKTFHKRLDEELLEYDNEKK